MTLAFSCPSIPHTPSKHVLDCPSQITSPWPPTFHFSLPHAFWIVSGSSSREKDQCKVPLGGIVIQVDALTLHSHDYTYSAPFRQLALDTALRPALSEEF